MTAQSIARIALALVLLAGVIFALWQHGKPLPPRRLHAAEMVGGTALEAILIWFAGGWG